MSGETNDSSVGVIEKVGSGNGDGDRKQEEGLVNTAFPQMVVSGVPRHTKKKDFEKLLASKSLKWRKIKVVPGKDFAFISFDDDSQYEAAEAILHGFEMKKNTLKVAARSHTVANNNKRPASNEDGGDDKRMKIDGKNDIVKSARDAVAPWWNVPYQEQLDRKSNAMKKDCLKKSLREVRDAYEKWNRQARRDGRDQVDVPKWIQSSSDEPSSWVNFLPIIESPEPLGYRNKCEFTFGTDSISGLPAVGFRVSNFKDGVLVGSPEDCPNIPKAMKKLVRAVNIYLRENCDLKVYDIQNHTGVWRLLTVRYSKRTGQMLLMVCVSLKAVDDESWSKELKKFTDCIQNIKHTAALDNEDNQEDIHEESCDLNLNENPLVSGLCYQVYDGLSVPSADHSAINVFGESCILERMNGCSFRISPQAFFQVNTPAAELLYNAVISALKNEENIQNKLKSELSANDILCLDVCSGTGTIGICCAKAGLGHVIGVELCQAAVNDAIDNAALNDLTLFANQIGQSSEKTCFDGNEKRELDQNTTNLTCGFICSRAEAVMDALICNGVYRKSSYQEKFERFQNMANGKKVLAVVDPPREGLHIDCIRAIRNCSRIDRLVYVSCNPTKSLPRDFAFLCGPSNKKMYGAPFQPVSATPVDLFPHTPHCEMMLVFERSSND